MDINPISHFVLSCRCPGAVNNIAAATPVKLHELHFCASANEPIMAVETTTTTTNHGVKKDFEVIFRLNR